MIQTFDVAAILRRLPHLDLAGEKPAADTAADAFPMLAPFGSGGLISPWLDASVSKEEQVAIAPRDLMLDIPGLAEVGRLYAGELDVTHPLVSPLSGDLHGLAPMIVFSGTHDLLHPDSVALADKAKQAGVPMELYVEKGLPHSYAMLPTPEGRQACAIIARAVARDGSRHHKASSTGFL